MFNKELLLELQAYIENHLSFQILESVSFQKSEELQNIEIEDFIKIKRQPTFQSDFVSFY